MNTVIVTGGAGFIGSALVRALIARTSYNVVNVDKLTYAANLDSVSAIEEDARYAFVQADVADRSAMTALFERVRPVAIFHLAAETHVDRSIDDPTPFIQTNIFGTFTLLETARAYWRKLSGGEANAFRFILISTDEVFGELEHDGCFTEESPYSPNSPYAASKAGADHLARAWHHTYGLPTIITNTCNNYGPFQFPEKLIPLMIMNAHAGKRLPVYGRGENVRDWLYVEDHAEALIAVLERGRVGETYAIGARQERRNIDTVRAICRIIDELAPDARMGKRESLIDFVIDRPGHDFRYAIDPGKVERELGWKARETFESGLEKTVRWYLANEAWRQRILSGAYRLERLGLAASTRE